MRSFGIGICDSDREYACGVMQYINRRDDLPFLCYAFTTMESAMEAVREKPIKLILTGDFSLCEKREDGFYLGDAVCINLSPFPEPGARAVFKYQSLPGLIRDTMKYLEKQPGEENLSCRTIAVFSPVGRCGKTRFARAYAARAAAGLYVGMEDYSGEAPTELLYLIRNRLPETESRLPDMIRKEEGWDSLSASGVAFDIRCITRNDLEWLNRILLDSGRYTRIVYDLGAAVPEQPAVLSLFDRIYMPVLEDPVSIGKKERFFQVLQDMGLTDILIRLREIRLPDRDENSPEMRQAVSRALEEEESFAGGTEGKMEENLPGKTGHVIGNP